MKKFLDLLGKQTTKVIRKKIVVYMFQQEVKVEKVKKLRIVRIILRKRLQKFEIVLFKMIKP